ncbi:hypothetical protein AB1N83_001911 [Pleurotus pulmonarius]
MLPVPSCVCSTYTLSPEATRGSASCARLGAAAALWQGNLTPSLLRIMRLSRNTSWLMRGSHCTGPMGGIPGVLAPNLQTDLGQEDWTRSSCWVCNLRRSKSSGPTRVNPGATTTDYAVLSPSSKVMRLKSDYHVLSCSGS